MTEFSNTGKDIPVKTLALIALVLSCSCNAKSEAEAPPKATPNLAAVVLTDAQPKAKCLDAYQDVGSDHVYSAVCTMVDEEVLYCALDAKTGPRCNCIANCKPTPAPTPAPTPVPASKK